MIDSLIDNDEDSTPLTNEELEELRLTFITTRDELNAAEQANIIKATQWANLKKREMLDQSFLKKLHQKMFEDVWKWASIYRKTSRNIGIDAYRIPTEVHQLIETVKYWIPHKTYTSDEIAARFHHQLVFIHPFPNGNGRLARLATDLLVQTFNKNPFTWGSQFITDPKKRRSSQH